jgi:uncharacterized protein (TIGR03435 family)
MSTRGAPGERADRGSPKPSADGFGVDGAPSLFSALQEQLGLKLENKAVPFDVIVVDGANRTPSEN